MSYHAATPMSVFDLAWLSGAWHGTVSATPSDCGRGPTEQMWDLCFVLSESGVLAGLWIQGQSLTVVSVRDIRGSIECRLHEIKAASDRPPLDHGLIMRMACCAHREVTFESTSALDHPRHASMRITFARPDDTSLIVRLAVGGRDGEWSTVREERLSGTAT